MPLLNGGALIVCVNLKPQLILWFVVTCTFLELFDTTPVRSPCMAAYAGHPAQLGSNVACTMQGSLRLEISNKIVQAHDINQAS